MFSLISEILLQAGSNAVDVPGPGESYNAPNDPWLEVQRRACEEPGVLAGFSHVDNLPILKAAMPLKGSQAHGVFSGYVYVPLVQRVDMDRIFRAVKDSAILYKVYPYGTGGKGGTVEQIYKVSPWSHLNCYKLRAKFKKQDKYVEIGAKYNSLQSQFICFLNSWNFGFNFVCSIHIHR